MSDQLPDHIRDAFQVGAGPAERLGGAWDHGFRIGNTVFSKSMNAEIAPWSSKLRESLRPEGVRVARPIRSTDGRFVVSGWRASVYSTGAVSQRVDETVVAALSLPMPWSTPRNRSSHRAVCSPGLISGHGPSSLVASGDCCAPSISLIRWDMPICWPPRSIPDRSHRW